MAGCGPQFLRATTPADRALYRAISEKASEQRRVEYDGLARRIRNEVVAALD